MKDYTFKPEFEKKLGSDKEAFIANLKKQNAFTEDNCDYLNILKNFETFILVGISWRTSRDKQKFWKKVSKR